MGSDCGRPSRHVGLDSEPAVGLSVLILFSPSWEPADAHDQDRRRAQRPSGLHCSPPSAARLLPARIARARRHRRSDRLTGSNRRRPQRPTTPRRTKSSQRDNNVPTPAKPLGRHPDARYYAYDAKNGPKTFALMVEKDWHLRCKCWDCGHEKDLPPSGLVDRYGPECTVAVLAPRLVCPVCPSKRVIGHIIQGPNYRGGGPPRSGAA